MLRLSEEQALVRIRAKYGIEMDSLGPSANVSNKAFQVLICDYRGLEGYEVSYMIAVYDASGDRMLDRFNVV